MTAIPAPGLSRHLFERGMVASNPNFRRGLAFVAALYLTVAIVELSIIVLAAPTVTEIGSLYVSVP